MLRPIHTFFNALDYYIKSQKLCQTFETPYFARSGAFFAPKRAFLPLFLQLSDYPAAIAPPTFPQHNILTFLIRQIQFEHNF